uniref:Ddb1 and cul4 associated factor 13 n=1 Tax=Sinocyclocheilus grahami TaxID=75366 RepID=A0A672S4P7_SINGR
MKVKALCRNSDDYNYPTLHPFEVPREYTRALNATKLERVFAKPFVASLDGHRDGITKHAKSLSTIISGACDGEVDDKTIRQWNVEAPGDGVREEPGQGTVVFTGIDHHQREGTFVTCGQTVDIWDEQRSSPIRSFSWGVDRFSCIRYNPEEVIEFQSHLISVYFS